MGAHVWRGVRWLLQNARGAADRQRWARSTRISAPAAAVRHPAADGTVALLEGPLPQRAPGAALKPETPSLLADEEDVVTWAIRIARDAASEQGAR
jgi:hypothetical protein